MDPDLEEEIETAVAKERAKWEKILENAQKVSDDYGVQVEILTSQLQELRQRFHELEERQSSVPTGAADKIKGLEEALTRARLECLDREKAASRRAREEGELALQREREVIVYATRGTCPDCPQLFSAVALPPPVDRMPCSARQLDNPSSRTN
jgi:hypothetical protein